MFFLLGHIFGHGFTPLFWNLSFDIFIHLLQKSRYPSSIEIDLEKSKFYKVSTKNIKDDPIFQIGKNPVSCPETDASENLDKYIY